MKSLKNLTTALFNNIYTSSPYYNSKERKFLLTKQTLTTMKDLLKQINFFLSQFCGWLTSEEDDITNSTFFKENKVAIFFFLLTTMETIAIIFFFAHKWGFITAF